MDAGKTWQGAKGSAFWLKAALLLVGATLAAWLLSGCSSGSTTASAEEGPVVPLVTAQEAYEQMESGDPNLVVLDVRTPEEYVLGHLVGAINVDFYDDDFREQLDQLDHDKDYIVYCRCGKRGAASVAMMEELGFVQARNLDEGYLEWQFQGLPTEE